MIYMKILKKVG